MPKDNMRPTNGLLSGMLHRVRDNASATDVTVESVVKKFLSDQRITEIRSIVSEVEFVPTGFGKAVRIKIYRNLATDEMPYFYQTSHYSHTPLQAISYIASDPWGSSAASAINRAVEELLSCLENAKSMGHEPHDDWLVNNAFWPELHENNTGSN